MNEVRLRIVFAERKVTFLKPRISLFSGETIKNAGLSRNWELDCESCAVSSVAGKEMPPFNVSIKRLHTANPNP